MKINFSQIYEGWKNNLFPAADMRDYIEEVSKERMAICEGCDFISTKHKSIRPDVHCTDCGCMLSAKTKCLSCACPKNKWEAVIDSVEEEEQLKTNIHGK
jgi:hypothetical protein